MCLISVVVCLFLFFLVLDLFLFMFNVYVCMTVCVLTCVGVTTEARREYHSSGAGAAGTLGT